MMFSDPVGKGIDTVPFESALLGLYSLLRRSRIAMEVDVDEKDSERVNEQVLYAALGIVSLEHSLRRWLTQAAGEPADATSRPSASTEGFMR